MSKWKRIAGFDLQLRDKGGQLYGSPIVLENTETGDFLYSVSNNKRDAHLIYVGSREEALSRLHGLHNQAIEVKGILIPTEIEYYEDI